MSFTSWNCPLVLPYVEPACHLFRFKSTETSIFPPHGRASAARPVWQPLSDLKGKENGFMERESSKSISTLVFHFSAACSFQRFSGETDCKYLPWWELCLFSWTSLAERGGEGRPVKLHSVKVYNGAWKVNTFCIQICKAHLVPLSLWWSVFLLPFSGYRPLHFPKQTCQG